MSGGWWIVVVDGEWPDYFGPYRSEARAEAEAEAFNARQDPADADADRATVRPVKSGPVR